MTTKTSKLSQAMEAYKTGNYKTNAEFVQYLIDNLGMSKLGARTYAYNVKQKLGREVMRMRLEPDVIEAAPKTKTKTKTPKAKKAPVAVEPTNTVSEQPVEDQDDPLAIPDFLQRPRTKAEGEVKARKPSRKAMEKAIMQATAMTTSATVSNA